MRIVPKQINLSKIGVITIHSPVVPEARALLAFERRIVNESEFMVRYESEITTSVADERFRIQSYLAKQDQCMIVAARNGEVIGQSVLSVLSPYCKARHRGTLSIAIEKQYWGNGVGTLLMEQTEEAAHLLGIRQLELEVATCNMKAISLYIKNGFTIYGTRKHAYQLRNGSYLDEYLMYKSL